ncbi:hypothetical protein RJT34_02122 [Clitoria ternatea]|uniref:Uncharacterized protein n=1 Tax=Clitoria ternatea TaxID=43366 RepID=A0AAN9Q3Q6_CLITE
MRKEEQRQWQNVQRRYEEGKDFENGHFEKIIWHRDSNDFTQKIMIQTPSRYFNSKGFYCYVYPDDDSIVVQSIQFTIAKRRNGHNAECRLEGRGVIEVKQRKRKGKKGGGKKEG